ncbi:DUF2637 domain-containing protein [Amycolatopsis sp. FDAARGOS 1241]|uniref:DUF2637 domain-containing protein n=1 Tax=Amycolatopsis sp. FDAARGOS 1241 TaxID=2778070 RepID=UPI001950AEE9|nr:DUF2637 domain-containing protein [Amycolatopsis sp. FDAARGOS 1241]QRP45777.1 hypothetical protein I6J71_42960 [Amycolatopsis sp. FDAARGOS 1241]
MSTQDTTQKTSRWATLAVFVPGLLVALGAAAATAHGLFEVAVASGVPGGIAWIYPLITDGLAIVAYAATSRLQDHGRRYAWAVVILAAGLSGLAQASYLAGGVGAALDPAAGEAMPATSGLLRFGVGAWPALAAAIVAHLLFMLATARRTDVDAAVDESTVPVPGAAVAVADRVPPSAPLAQPDRVQRSAVQSPSVQPGPVQPEALNTSMPPVPGGRTAEPSPGVQSPGEREAVEVPAKPERPAAVASSPKKDRARAEARKHQARTGTLPTVDELMKSADVSRGTAGTALQELRQQPAPLHVITELDTQQANS